MLRRNFNTYLLSRPNVSISSALLLKHYFTIKRIFLSSNQRNYNNQFTCQSQRLFTSYKNTASQNVPTINSRAQRASQVIKFCPLLSLLYTKSLYKKRPLGYQPRDKDAAIEEKYNQDQDLQFYNSSKLFKEFLKLKARKGTAACLCQLLKKLQAFTNKLVNVHSKLHNFNTITTYRVALVFTQHSPKIQAILSLYIDQCLLRNKKIIFQFNIPVLQILAQEVIEVLSYNIFSVYLHNNTN